jgi:hypothetical protein
LSGGVIMQRNIRQGLAAVVLSASLISINTPATQAMVIPVTTATAIAGSPPTEQVGWRGYGYGWRGYGWRGHGWRGGWGWGGGALAAGLVVGGLIGAAAASPYYGYPAYGYAYPAYYYGYPAYYTTRPTGATDAPITRGPTDGAIDAATMPGPTTDAPTTRGPTEGATDAPTTHVHTLDGVIAAHIGAEWCGASWRTATSAASCQGIVDLKRSAPRDRGGERAREY